MKKALAKSAFREIRSTMSRFLSIFGIVAIGVGFFSGVKAAAPDMRNTVDEYLDGARLMDVRLVSTYGFDDNDIAAVGELDGALVYPSYFTDMVAHYGDRSPAAARLISLSPFMTGGEANSFEITEGRMPENDRECLVCSTKMMGGPSVGDTVVFTDNNGREPSDMLSVYEYTIVGKARTAMYIDKTTRGSTSVGNGSIESIYYIPERDFCVEYNTEVYVRFPALESLNCYSSEYKDAVEALSDEAERIGERRANERFDEIMTEADEELSDAEKELADAEQEYNDKIADAEKEIADGEAEIAENERKLIDGEAEIAENEQKLTDAEAEIAENEQKLEDARKQYNDGLNEYNDGLAEYSSGIEEYEKNLAELNGRRAELEAAQDSYSSGLAALESGKEQLTSQKAALEAAEAQAAAALGLPALTDEIIAQYAEVSPDIAQIAAARQAISDAQAEIDANEQLLAGTKAQLDEAQKQLEAGEAQLAEGKKILDDSRKQLDDAKNQLDSAKTEIDDGSRELEDAKQEVADGWKELEDGRKEIEDGKRELADARVKLEDGKKELDDAKKEGADKIADSKEKLADARKEVEDLSKPKWYVFTRDGNPGYSEYGENADRINNIAGVFPVFFIVVAMLVCLTTMSRMVEEQRVGIGTLKALGYANASIIFKYMLYAVSATILGCVFGCAVGMYLFPYVIISAYGMMYDIPNMSISIDLITAISASLIFTAAIVLTVFLTTRSALSEQAAQLMRPKAPKNGKRILLEHITPIWKHFGFSGKVTARNLFRYKRKMLMTVIGISGCTALLLTGLALYDAINDIIAKQFEDIQNYDGIYAYDRDEHPEAADEAAEIVASHGGEALRVYQKLVTVNANGKSVDAYIAVPEEPDKFTGFFDLRSRTTGEKYALTDDSVYIDEKSSLLLGGIGGGDSIEIEKSETEKYTVTLTAPFENYPNHYVYMTEAGYERIFGEKPGYNVLYFRHGLGTGEAQDKLGEELLSVEGALSVTFNSNTMVTFTQMLDTLSMVIIVIIVSAGLLAFVVLYNLTNINITERIREIATLKVLGFYDGEVDSYIFRENIFLAAIGTAAGLVLGVFLARFVITTAEVDIVMFGRNIYPLSFVLAAAATMLFAVLVTAAMHGRLKNVDMIEALKSVE